MAREPKQRQRIRISRDIILFAVGLAGVIHETVFYSGERPSLLILFAGMCGLPLYLRRNGI